VNQFKEYLPGVQEFLDILYPYVRKGKVYKLDERGEEALRGLRDLVAKMKPLKIFTPGEKCTITGLFTENRTKKWFFFFG